MAFRSLTDTLTTHTTSITLTTPAGAAAGDRLWAFFHLGGEFGSAWTGPAGWSNFLTSGSKRLWTISLSAAPAASYTWTWTGAMFYVYGRALAYDSWPRFNYQATMAQEYHTGLTVGHFDGNYLGTSEGGLYTNGPTTRDPGVFEARFPYIRMVGAAKGNAAVYPAYPVQTTNDTWNQRATYNAQIAPADNANGVFLSVTYDVFDLLDHDDEGEPTQLFHADISGTDIPSRNSAWGAWGNAAGVAYTYVPGPVPADEEGGGSIYERRHATARALPYQLTTGRLQGVPWHEIGE